jgi:hypothetical protein
VKSGFRRPSKIVTFWPDFGVLQLISSNFTELFSGELTFVFYHKMATAVEIITMCDKIHTAAAFIRLENHHLVLQERQKGVETSREAVK